MLSQLVLPVTNYLAVSWIGLDASPIHHWAVAFLLAFVALLPATVAIGATLPTMERLLAPLRSEGRVVGALYAINTAGALLGVIAAAFVLMPRIGLAATAKSLAGFNIAAAALLFVFRHEKLHVLSAVCHHPTSDLKLTRLYPLLFAIGLLGIGYEVTSIRLLSQTIENTVYSFASLLAVYLLGAATGAAAYQRWLRGIAYKRLLAYLLAATSASCVLGLFAIANSAALYAWAQQSLPAANGSTFLAEISVALSVLWLPALSMGALFSHAAQKARLTTGSLGRAVAWNTLGGAAASVAFTVLLLPNIGGKWTMAIICLGYGLLISSLPWLRLGSVLFVILSIIPLPKDLKLLDIPPAAELIAYHEGVMGSVAVLETPDGHRTLRVDNRFQMGGTAASAAEQRHAHIPLLLHPKPQRALFLGLGTGITMGTTALYESLRADGVELIPEVVQVMNLFAPHNNSPTSHQRMRVYVADARRFVQTAQTQYDVVVGDLFHPARDGAGMLYSLEHFQAIRQRLVEGGIFCQWLPLHQLDLQTCRMITHTFVEVFPWSFAYLLRFNIDVPVLGLIGYKTQPGYDAEWIEKRALPSGLLDQLKDLSLGDSIRLFGSLLATPDSLITWAGAAPLNTDNHPRVTFAAPALSYGPNTQPHQLLLELLSSLGADPELLFSTPESQREKEFITRLRKYISARDQYIRGLASQADGNLAEAINGYLQSTRTSSDFTLGYAQAISIATAFINEDPELTKRILQQLHDAQPARRVAGELLQRLFGP